ncbi:riboflavin synthase [Thermodesulforhabdus norvegica]|uniref:Riboflavin synthase n=1 Tax=Thermodesulforhabdus norvegica TaxID=39841 RepID=A0A1I4RIX9_9BACT|nr:riboflavin synthase [Thermodesulforhabdus norvegica]SFM52198.1 riboflavin synthase alpha chain [Thermodesulforhabdus norvegica]
MFTGLVEGLGTVVRINPQGVDKRIFIRPDFDPGEIIPGESIAIDGACLTVVAWDGSVFAADVSSETLRRTTIGDRKPGDKVNLERALRLGDRFGGHIVMGHVDAVGVVTERYEEGRSVRFSFRIPADLAKYVVEKGSITVNGVSLTVNSCRGSLFDVNIIPHTAAMTNIGLLKVGDRVNIEVDIIGKYVEKLLKGWNTRIPTGDRINEDFLKEHGFI